LRRDIISTLKSNNFDSQALAPKVLPLREQWEVRDRWLRERLDTVLPALMKRTNTDMWVVITDENNEDPVTKSLLPSRLINARGKMIFAFIMETDGSLTRQSISIPSGIEDLYQNEWYGMNSLDWKGKQFKKPETTAFEFLAQLISRRDPKTIAINTDNVDPFADGLTYTNYTELRKALDEKYIQRLVSGRPIAVAWLETRCPSEIMAYEGIVRLAKGIITECFTTSYITPGITTNDDLRFAMMQRAIDMGITPWFECSVAIFRGGYPGMHGDTHVIMPGDIIHCDFGISYLGLCTDRQELGYILRLGETEAPEGLRAALKTANRLQDIVVSNIRVGKTGNDILRASRTAAESEGIDPWIYTHPIGFDGHGAGTVIGRFSNQEGTPAGELPINDNTAYALELNAKVPVAEWDNQILMTCIETEILLYEGRVHFLAERQESLHLI